MDWVAGGLNGPTWVEEGHDGVEDDEAGGGGEGRSREVSGGREEEGRRRNRGGAEDEDGVEVCAECGEARIDRVLGQSLRPLRHDGSRRRRGGAFTVAVGGTPGRWRGGRRGSRVRKDFTGGVAVEAGHYARGAIRPGPVEGLGLEGT